MAELMTSVLSFVAGVLTFVALAAFAELVIWAAGRHRRRRNGWRRAREHTLLHQDQGERDG